MAEPKANHHPGDLTREDIERFIKYGPHAFEYYGRSDKLIAIGNMALRAAEAEKDAARYRAVRDGDVVARTFESRWEARHRDAPHFQLESWHLCDTLDAAIDAAMSPPQEGA